MNPDRAFEKETGSGPTGRIPGGIQGGEVPVPPFQQDSRNPLLTAQERKVLEHSFFGRRQLEEQYRDLVQQHDTAAFGMWVFLATEVMFFGPLFLSVGVYRYLYGEAFEQASAKLNWMIGGINTVLLLVSSFLIVLAVHYARLGRRSQVVRCLVLTALLGIGFLCFKGLEYYTDYVENLIPGWRFDPQQWVENEHLTPDQVPQVMLFLSLYWIMTGLHALHVTIGILVVLWVALLAHQGRFSAAYYTPVEVTALYWHFVDVVWIFLLPMLYLLGTHTWNS